VNGGSHRNARDLRLVGKERCAFSVLRSRDFRLLLAGQALSLTGSQMQQIAMAGVPSNSAQFRHALRLI
jgi:hypothetical protein